MVKYDYSSTDGTLLQWHFIHDKSHTWCNVELNLGISCLLGLFNSQDGAQYIPPKHQWMSTRLHSTASHKIILFTVTAVGTSNPTRSASCILLNSVNFSDYHSHKHQTNTIYSRCRVSNGLTDWGCTIHHYLSRAVRYPLPSANFFLI